MFICVHLCVCAFHAHVEKHMAPSKSRHHFLSPSGHLCAITLAIKDACIERVSTLIRVFIWWHTSACLKCSGDLLLLLWHCLFFKGFVLCALMQWSQSHPLFWLNGKNRLHVCSPPPLSPKRTHSGALSPWLITPTPLPSIPLTLCPCFTPPLH